MGEDLLRSAGERKHFSLNRKAEALREAIEYFLGRSHLPAFGLRYSFIEFRTLLRRHPVVEGTNGRTVRIFATISHV
jgi:hypothetical protein